MSAFEGASLPIRDVDVTITMTLSELWMNFWLLAHLYETGQIATALENRPLSGDGQKQFERLMLKLANTFKPAADTEVDRAMHEWLDKKPE